MSNCHGGARSGSGRKKKGAPEVGASTYERCTFTPKQIKALLNSPYVSSISCNSITYTKEFKEWIWQRYCDGIDPKQVFRDVGIDPIVLGPNRIKGLIDALREQKERGLPFNEGREPHSEIPEKLFKLPVIPRKPKNSMIEITPNELSKLVHQVKFLTQEMEFLKKIILVEKGVK